MLWAMGMHVGASGGATLYLAQLDKTPSASNAAANRAVLRSLRDLLKAASSRMDCGVLTDTYNTTIWKFWLYNFQYGHQSAKSTS